MSEGQNPKPKAKRRRRGGGGGSGGGSGGQGGGQQGQGGGQGQKARRPDLWRPVPQLADPAPIVGVSDPTALVWSLGDLPLQGQGENGKHYVSKVVERAAVLANALAASVDLYVESAPDDDED